MLPLVSHLPELNHVAMLNCNRGMEMELLFFSTLTTFIGFPWLPLAWLWKGSLVVSGLISRLQLLWLLRLFFCFFHFWASWETQMHKAFLVTQVGSSAVQSWESYTQSPAPCMSSQRQYSWSYRAFGASCSSGQCSSADNACGLCPVNVFCMCSS